MTLTSKVKQTIINKYNAAGIESMMTPAELIDWNKMKAYRVRLVFSNGHGEISSKYKMGLGLFDNDVLIPENEFEKRRGFYEKNGCYNMPKLSEKLTEKYFEPEVIFAQLCNEASDAMEHNVENYCEIYFGNADSHKGHVTHAELCEKYLQLYRMMEPTLIEELAELANEL